MSDAWSVEPHKPIAELEPDYEPVRTNFVPLEQKLTGNEWAALKAYARQASIGEPDADT